MTKKKYIKTYGTVYGVDIVIANMNVGLTDLTKDYTYSDNIELDEDVMECLASTSTAKNRKTNRYCILVKLNNLSSIKGINKTLDLINTASHEALHAALRLYQFAGQDIDVHANNENLAYLVGWLTEIIYGVWTMK